MLRVGLTGGLGSGKSTVGAMFRALGAHVIDADAVGRSLMQPGQQVYRNIVERFGQHVVQENGELDRAELARLAFDGGRMEELNSIVHPAVIAEQTAWMQEIAEHEPDAVAIIESALIFETRHGGGTRHGGTMETRRGETKQSQTPPSGGIEAHSTGIGEADGPSQRIAGRWNERFDRIILVCAPEALRISRYVDRISGGKLVPAAERAALEADARRRLGAQLPDEQKIPFCDFVIENTGGIAAAESAVERIHGQLQEMSRLNSTI